MFVSPKQCNFTTHSAKIHVLQNKRQHYCLELLHLVLFNHVLRRHLVVNSVCLNSLVTK